MRIVTVSKTWKVAGEMLDSNKHTKLENSRCHTRFPLACLFCSVVCYSHNEQSFTFFVFFLLSDGICVCLWQVDDNVVRSIGMCCPGMRRLSLAHCTVSLDFSSVSWLEHCTYLYLLLNLLYSSARNMQRND